MRFDMRTDVLIVGSGPIACVFARCIADALPSCSILMVEAGPKLTSIGGVHVRHIGPPDERSRAQRESEGPASVGEQEHRSGPVPGTFPVSTHPASSSDMPGAAMSSNVGGMGAHWAGACPTPDRTERTPLITEACWEDALGSARGLLSVTTDAFASCPRTDAALAALRSVFATLPEGRQPQRMPMACLVARDGRRWAGTDLILGDLAHESRFDLKPKTLCRRLMVRRDVVLGAELVPLPSGEPAWVSARAVIVAADAFRTPQLLWNSGIRPRALGHYLNEHIMTDSLLTLGAQYSHLRVTPFDADDRWIAMLWVPFSERNPLHGQLLITHARRAADGTLPEPVVSMRWYAPKEVRFEDCVRFSDVDVDGYGMPAMTIDYSLTPGDLAAARLALAAHDRAKDVIGTYLPDTLPTVSMPGSSLHYQGTVRMGDNEADSVCDSHSQVWGMRNLFVGGNGVIGTRTAGNPTLMSAALAVRSAARVTAIIQDS